MRTADRIRRIYLLLETAYPQVDPTLRFDGPFQLLVAVILSAQTTDVQVNAVTPRLFARYPDARSLAAADVTNVESVVRSTGFYRTKARHIVDTARLLAEHHGGEVPVAMEDLTALPGVGRKSAHVVRGVHFHLPAIIVDTHFQRVVGRLELAMEENPARIEGEIAELLPEDWCFPFSMRANQHGRAICHARRPECALCPIGDCCPYPVRQGDNEPRS